MFYTIPGAKRLRIDHGLVDPLLWKRDRRPQRREMEVGQMAIVKVGTSSWTDPTLLRSGWYPPQASSPADRLGYYASRFSLVEVDSTYYSLPSERNSVLWAERTPPDFTFNI